MRILDLWKCAYFSLKHYLCSQHILLNVISVTDACSSSEPLLPLRQPRSNFTRAGSDPDQQHGTGELSAGQSEECSPREQAGTGNTLKNSLLLGQCYSPNARSESCMSATITIWTYLSIFWWEEECSFPFL